MTESLLEEAYVEGYQAYVEGYQAYQSGSPEHANPYQGHSIDHELWSDGYDDAQEDEKHV